LLIVPSALAKDVKAEAALAKLNAASDASIAKMEKCNAAKVYDRKCAPLKESLASWAANLDCSVAIVDKHNREFPSEPWASIAAFRDSMVGKPDAERLKKANACVDHGGIIQP
jgi:hypothetical protein